MDTCVHSSATVTVYTGGRPDPRGARDPTQTEAPDPTRAGEPDGIRQESRDWSPVDPARPRTSYLRLFGKLGPVFVRGFLFGLMFWSDLPFGQNKFLCTLEKG